MSAHTSIEWTDTTWNPTRGCTRVSEGCRHCYAEQIAARFSGPGLHSEGFARRVDGEARWTGRVELVPEKLDEPLRWRKPRRIFVNSMSDLFHESLSDDVVGSVFGAMAAARRHTFQVLTKRPERMKRWFERMIPEPGMVPHAEVRGCVLALLRKWRPGTHPEGVIDQTRGIVSGNCPAWPLPNVWLGVSVEDQATADERIPLLLQTPAAIRFVSYEPALGPVDFTELPYAAAGEMPAAWAHQRVVIDALSGYTDNGTHKRVDWVIVGGESGPNARPFSVALARRTIDQCREAGVACFVKQLGARPLVGDEYRIVGDAKTWPLGTGFESEDQRDPLVPPYRVILGDRKGGEWWEWPDDLRVREFPAR